MEEYFDKIIYVIIGSIVYLYVDILWFSAVFVFQNSNA